MSARTGADRILLVHGFTQTVASWDDLAPRLEAAGHEVVRLHVAGHGDATDVRVDLWGSADHLAATGGAGTWLGYSMGGRTALHVALAHPELVARLVLVSASAGMDEPERRAARRASDEQLAADLERDGVDAFLERWLALPLFAGLPDDAPGRADRRSNTAAGLASSLRLAGTGTMDPLWDRLGELAMPVLVVVGADDAAYVAAGRRLVAGIGPRATLVVVPDSGHTVHLEQPEAFATALLEWLARSRPDEGQGSAPTEVEGG